MFILTPFKILLLALVIGGVWFASRVIKRRDRVMAEMRTRMERDGKTSGTKGSSPASEPAAQEMVPCAKCGTYVIAGQGARCERPDCPFPG
jgi:hypothetical protein